MKIYFEAKDRMEMKMFFEETLETLSGEKLEIYETLLKLCRENGFRQITGITNEFRDLYENTLKDNVRCVFEKWEESDASIQAFLLTMGAGDKDDEIISIAREFEEQLREFVMQIVSKEMEIPISTNIPQVDIETTMEKIEDAYDIEIKKVNALKGDVRRKEREKEDENDIYISLCVLLNGILEEYEKFFKTLKKGIKQYSKEVLKPQSKKVVQAVRDEKENNKMRATNLEDLLLSEADIFKDILF